jgi:hypothetical protein
MQHISLHILAHLIIDQVFGIEEATARILWHVDGLALRDGDLAPLSITEQQTNNKNNRKNTAVGA